MHPREEKHDERSEIKGDERSEIKHDGLVDYLAYEVAFKLHPEYMVQFYEYSLRNQVIFEIDLMITLKGIYHIFEVKTSSGLKVRNHPNNQLQKARRILFDRFDKRTK